MGAKPGAAQSLLALADALPKKEHAQPGVAGRYYGSRPYLAVEYTWDEALGEWVWTVIFDTLEAPTRVTETDRRLGRAVTKVAEAVGAL